MDLGGLYTWGPSQLEAILVESAEWTRTGPSLSPLGQQWGLECKARHSNLWPTCSHEVDVVTIFYSHSDKVTVNALVVHCSACVALPPSQIV
jgi:hypothetical protein